MASITSDAALGRESTGPTRDFVGYGRRPPRIAWPDGRLLAVNLVVCYEEGAEYSVADGDPRSDGWGEYPLSAEAGVRDLGTETHFEYGSRVGIWRIARLLERHGVPATISACAQALQRNPEVAAWLRGSGHDLLGHGLRWAEQWTMTRAEERDQLHRSIAIFTELLGERPLGWNSRSYPSVNTRELLIEEGGFLYNSDPCNDDLPYYLRTPKGPLLVVPYSKTLNDSRYLISPGYARPQDFVDNVRDYLDFILAEARELGGRMMTIAVHARWTGQPNRAAALLGIIEAVQSRPEAVFMRRLDIARHWLATLPGRTNGMTRPRADHAGQPLRRARTQREPWGCPTRRSRLRASPTRSRSGSRPRSSRGRCRRERGCGRRSCASGSRSAARRSARRCASCRRCGWW